MFETITRWDVLENLFVDKCVPRKYTYSLLLKLVEIHMNEKEIIKYFTFIFMKVIDDIPQEMFPNNVIIFSCYEHAFPMNLKFLLKKEGKCNWKELMQLAQVIEINVLETDANILNFPIFFQDNKGMDSKEIFDERHEFFFSISYS
jgi:hypothetical protein